MKVHSTPYPPYTSYKPYEQQDRSSTNNSHPTLGPIPYRHSPSTSSFTSSLTNESQLQMKSMLKHRLMGDGQLPHMPFGFPFRLVPNHQGGSQLSYGPYEFHEELNVSNHWEPVCKHTVMVSFTPQPRRDGQCYIWRISLPTVSSYGKHSQASRMGSQTVSAEVQVESAITGTPYFASITMNPKIISRALAISLEFGLRIQIQLADQAFATLLQGSKCTSSRNLPVAGDIIYLGTNTSGEQQVIHVIDGQTLLPKFSTLYGM